MPGKPKREEALLAQRLDKPLWKPTLTFDFIAQGLDRRTEFDGCLDQADRVWRTRARDRHGAIVETWQDRLAEVQAEVDALKRVHDRTATELAALMPSILAKAFEGEL